MRLPQPNRWSKAVNQLRFVLAEIQWQRLLANTNESLDPMLPLSTEKEVQR